MRYFIVNLAMHLVITGIIVLFACISADHNKRKKTKHVINYFFPIVFALAALLHLINYTAPRLMDVSSIINNNYYYTTGSVEKISYLKNYFLIDGKSYYLNPLHNKLAEGDVVRVKHTPYSSFTVEIKSVTESESEGDTSSSKEN